MPYPPEDHLLRDLQITSWREADDRACAQLDVVDAVRDATGAVSLGALVTLADVASARVTLAAVAPDWTATIDLTVTSAARLSDGVVRADAHVTRVGSNIVGVDVDLGAAGAATASFARIPREASLVAANALPEVGARSGLERTGPPLTVPVAQRMGLRLERGTAELERSDYVGNSFGTINGGVLGFVVAGAAESATARTATDVTLRYLDQTKVGPARATTTILRERADHAVVDVTVRDAGASGLLLARAVVTVT